MLCVLTNPYTHTHTHTHLLLDSMQTSSKGRKKSREAGGKISVWRRATVIRSPASHSEDSAGSSEHFNLSTETNRSTHIHLTNPAIIKPAWPRSAPEPQKHFYFPQTRCINAGERDEARWHTFMRQNTLQKTRTALDMTSTLWGFQIQTAMRLNGEQIESLKFLMRNRNPVISCVDLDIHKNTQQMSLYVKAVSSVTKHNCEK